MGSKAKQLAEQLEKKCQTKVNDLNAAYDRYGLDNSIKKNFPLEYEIINFLRNKC